MDSYSVQMVFTLCPGGRREQKLSNSPGVRVRNHRILSVLGQENNPSSMGVVGMVSFSTQLVCEDALTKHSTLGDLKNRGVFSCSSAGWQSKIKVSAGLAPLSPLPSACRQLLLPVSSRGLWSVCTHPTSIFIRTPVPSNRDPH